MSKERKALLADAIAAGYAVREDRSGAVWIMKPRGFGLVIWPDGTAMRTDVELTFCKTLRGYAMFRKVLGL